MAVSRLEILVRLKRVLAGGVTDVHMGRQKVPKSDFQSHFSMSKIIRIFLYCFFIEEY